MKSTSPRTCSPCQLVALCLAMAAVPAFAGNNEYVTPVPVTDGIADVTLTVNDTIIDKKLSGDGINTLRFTRGNGMSSVKLRSTDGNTLPGGIIADGFLLKIQNPNVLGAGPVLLKNQWSGLYGDYYSALAAIDVANRVVFDTVSSYAAGEETKNLVLRNIGVTDANANKVVTLGRERTGKATVTLALDGDQNDAVGYFNLRGNLALTIDGGTLRAAAGDSRDLSQKVNDQATPNITVCNSPLTVDVAEGGSARFGVSPTFAKTKTTLQFAEEYKPSNWSFEEGKNGWTFSNGDTYTRGAAFDANGTWGPNDGDKYAMVRNGATLTREIEIPTDGLWCVVFDMGCRDGNYSLNIGTTVTIDAASVLTIAKLTDESQTHGFEEVRSEPHTLTAGKHDFKIELSSTGGFGSLNFDAIRFERYEEVYPDFAIAKAGAGTFVLNDFNQDALPIAVQAGTLACENTVLPNAAISVASGAELNAAGLVAAGTTIDVAAGGKFSIRADGDSNLIANGSFETPSTADNAFYWPNDCKWTLYPWDSSGNRPVIQRNGGTYCPSGANSYPTPYGDQFLLLRVGEVAYQQVSLSVGGTYVLSFAQSHRKGYQSPGLAVTIDDNAVLTVSGEDAQHDFEQIAVPVNLTAGTHTIRFTALDGNEAGQYSRLSIDDVSLVNTTMPPCDLSSTTLKLKSGSIVRLNNAEKLHVGTVLVDGVAVRGGADALRAAGVTVEGNGRIQCGNPLGLTVSLR